MKVYVEGIGLCGPGLKGWLASCGALTGRERYVPDVVIVPQSELLTANERRRAVPLVRVAIAVASEAFAHAGRDPTRTASVFTSSSGDGETVHHILDALTLPEREVSPTRFHNSVHNAPSGYWSIATRSCEPTTSVSGHDASFSIGLLEAAVQASVDARPVALVAYEVPLPAPLHAGHPIGGVFGVALVLTPDVTEHSFAHLAIKLQHDAVAPSALADAALEALRANNPAARSLPLIMALARGATDTVVLAHSGRNWLVVSVQPL